MVENYSDCLYVLAVIYVQSHLITDIRLREVSCTTQQPLATCTAMSYADLSAAYQQDEGTRLCCVQFHCQRSTD